MICIWSVITTVPKYQVALNSKDEWSKIQKLWSKVWTKVWAILWKFGFRNSKVQSLEVAKNPKPQRLEISPKSEKIEFPSKVWICEFLAAFKVWIFGAGSKVWSKLWTFGPNIKKSKVWRIPKIQRLENRPKLNKVTLPKFGFFSFLLLVNFGSLDLWNCWPQV